MKIKATYSCGHDATRNFDGRNVVARINSRAWEAQASTRGCPCCNETRRVAAINALDAEGLRQILINLVTHNVVAQAIDDAAIQAQRTGEA
jgi:hypothetical protein